TTLVASKRSARSNSAWGEYQSSLALLPGGNSRPDEADLVINVFDGTGEFVTIAACLAYQAPRVSLSQHKVRLGGVNGRLLDCDLHSERCGVKLYQYIARLYPVVVIDQNARHLSGHARCDKGHVTIHVRVVGRDGV